MNFRTKNKILKLKIIEMFSKGFAVNLFEPKEIVFTFQRSKPKTELSYFNVFLPNLFK